MTTKSVQLAIRDPTPYNKWYLVPPGEPNRSAVTWRESASIALIEESLRRYAEIAKYGRDRFQGSVAQRNTLWYEFRNYMRQAQSNFSASVQVGGRSSTLLQYYALLNFAKAELLDTHSAQLVDKRIGHGLSFNPTRAKSVAGDFLTVTTGVFPMLYERRTGKPLPQGTKLPIARLLANVPEISQQLLDSAVGRPNTVGLNQLVAFDDTHCWSVLGMEKMPNALASTSTRALLLRHFDLVRAVDNWRENWAWSRRESNQPLFFESKKKIVLPADKTIPMGTLADSTTWNLRDILSRPGADEEWDAVVTPYLFQSKTLSMPASLARYAISYFASSLVRYKPAMFDTQAHPEQALLFDAIGRESALPMLVDTLCAIERRENFFRSAGSLRV